MGRTAGVSAEETRGKVLRGAARIFAHRGYEGATITEIATSAKLSTGSIYAHFAGKAELFSAVLEAHGRPQLARRLHDDRPFDITDYLSDAGADLHRPAAERTLLIEAVMAAKHDPKLRRVLSRWFGDQQSFFTSAIAAAQAAGTMNDDFTAAAAARFATAVVLGSMVLNVLDVPDVEPEAWSDVVHQIVDSLRAREHDRTES